MKTFRLPIFLFIVGLLLMTSCKTYQSFPKGERKNQKTDFSDPNVRLQFEKGKVYRIWMDDSDKVIDLILYDVQKDRLVGVLEKNNFKQTGFLAKIEIPLNRINHMKVKKPFVVGTVAIVGVSLVAFYYGITALLVDSFFNGL